MSGIVRTLIAVVLVVCSSLSAFAEVSDDTGPLGGCPPGTYRFLVAKDARVREVAIRDGNAVLVPGCSPSKVQLAASERGATVEAEWPSCEGAASRVKLEGRIHGAFCEQFDGTVQVGKAEPRDVHGELVGCRVQYPNEAERKTTLARAVSACVTEQGGDPWKDAQDFGRLYYAVQAKLGCNLEN
jgi:hypothetical protein